SATTKARRLSCERGATFDYWKRIHWMNEFPRLPRSRVMRSSIEPIRIFIASAKQPNARRRHDLVRSDASLKSPSAIHFQFTQAVCSRCGKDVDAQRLQFRYGEVEESPELVVADRRVECWRTVMFAFDLAIEDHHLATDL